MRVLPCATPELLEKAAACQPRFAHDGSIFGAPVVLLVCLRGRRRVGASVRPNECGAYRHRNRVRPDDEQATELGLGTCWVCHFKPEIAREQFDLPEGVYPYHMLTVGYAADTIASPERRAERTIAREDFLL